MAPFMFSTFGNLLLNSLTDDPFHIIEPGLIVLPLLYLPSHMTQLFDWSGLCSMTDKV